MKGVVRRAHWVIWWLLVAIVIVGAVAFEVSSSPTVTSIDLTPGATAELAVTRLRPHALSLSLEFERTSSQDRPELGTWSPRGDSKEQGFLEFDQPGARVLLAVDSAGTRTVYEALPASGYGTTSIHRDMVPLVDDANPHRFPWRSDLPERIGLPAGTSRLSVSVLEVGDPLRGERVRLLVKPPVTWKAVARGYEGIWGFVFWRMYLGVMALYGLILWWRAGPPWRKARRAGIGEPRPKA